VYLVENGVLLQSGFDVGLYFLIIARPEINERDTVRLVAAAIVARFRYLLVIGFASNWLPGSHNWYSLSSSVLHGASAACLTEDHKLEDQRPLTQEARRIYPFRRSY
jgi:hypothetical protein